MNAHRDISQDSAFAAWWRTYIRGGVTIDDVNARPLRVVDLFCGSGGFGLGASLAAQSFGRRAVFGTIVDTDEEALRVYARSLPVRKSSTQSVSMLVDSSVDEDGGEAAFDYPPELIGDTLASEIGRTDLLIAGPPCQGHSNLNNYTRRDDPRNDLFVTTVGIAVALEVPALVIENVPTVVNSHGDVVEIAKRLLQREGYGFAEGVLNMASLGGWQTRRRFFLIAVKGKESSALQAEMDQWRSAAGHVPRHSRDSLPCLWAIEDLADLVGIGSFETPPVQGSDNVERIRSLYERDLHDMPLDLRPECHREGTSYTAVYGRMHADRPAPTITTGIGTPGQGRFLHPTRPRLITPHEAARLQSFPDGYGFVSDRPPSRKGLAKWIGDAVPPFLGAIAAGIAMSALLDEPFNPPWT